MKFKPLFNPSVMTFSMVVPDIAPSEGIQKICGFSRGLKFHQVDYKPYWHISNSIVLGCNRSENEDYCRLWLYAYVDGKHYQQLIMSSHIGTKLNCTLHWGKYDRIIATLQEPFFNSQYAFVLKDNKTLPVGWLLNNYAEIDNTNNKTPFHCQVEDLRVNGRVVKI